MSGTHVVVEGTLKPDGSLELVERLALPPGRVRVTVESLTAADAPEGDLIEVLEQIRHGQAARGFVGRTKEEIDANVSALRDELEDRMRDVEQFQEQHPHAREKPAC